MKLFLFCFFGVDLLSFPSESRNQTLLPWRLKEGILFPNEDIVKAQGSSIGPSKLRWAWAQIAQARIHGGLSDCTIGL